MSAPQELTDRDIVLRLARDVMGWESRMARSGNIYASARMPNSFPALDHLIWGNDTDAPQWNPLESHDAVAEALALLPQDRTAHYIHELELSTLDRDGHTSMFGVLTATPREKCLAILRAMEGAK